MIERDPELSRSLEKLEFPRLISYLKSLCQTELGEKYLDEIPIVFDKSALSREYLLVGQAHCLVARNIYPDLTGAKDVRASIGRAAKPGSFLPGKELHDISVLLHIADSTRKSLLKQKTELREISEIGFRLYPDSILEYNINRAVDEDGNVKDDASKELRQVRTSLFRTRTAVRKKIISLARSLSEQEYSEDDIFTQRDGRLVLPVKAEFKRQIQGLIHGSSASGQTVFIEPSGTVDLNNEVISLQFEEQREVERILRELTDSVREVVPQLSQNLDVIAFLDSLYSRATYAVRLTAVVPAVGAVPVPRLVKARHPLLVIKLGRDKVSPIDMFLDDSTRVVVISGPNSGGKTVTLKTVGIFALCTRILKPLTSTISSPLSFDFSTTSPERSVPLRRTWSPGSKLTGCSALSSSFILETRCFISSTWVRARFMVSFPALVSRISRIKFSICLFKSRTILSDSSAALFFISAASFFAE